MHFSTPFIIYKHLFPQTELLLRNYLSWMFNIVLVFGKLYACNVSPFLLTFCYVHYVWSLLPLCIIPFCIIIPLCMCLSAAFSLPYAVHRVPFSVPYYAHGHWWRNAWVCVQWCVCGPENVKTPVFQQQRRVTCDVCVRMCVVCVCPSLYPAACGLVHGASTT